MKSRIPMLVLLLLAVLALSAGCNMAEQSAVSQPELQISTPAPDITCDQLVTLAETTVGLVCNSMGRNQACYGNRLISVDFQPNSGVTFQQSGDIVDLLAIRRLSTSPLNIRTRDWGIAVIKAQANLPEALPGQNVTFLIYGDTTLDSPSPQMNAVTVNTRIGSTTCEDAPDSGLLIQSPQGMQVAMNINGADVTLGSTAFITTNPENQRMTFAILEGEGIVTAFGVSETVLPGMKTGVQLGGGPDGLLAVGPPNEPAPYDPEIVNAHLPVNLLERQIEVPPPLDVTPVPTATEVTACTPRQDWQYRYTIQRGDYLALIAQKLNIRTADLQEGNCIEDPNRLIAGQQLRVPFPVATSTPLPTPTPPASPTSAAPTGPNLRADQNPIGYHSCTTIRWDVDNIREVYFEGQPVTGHDSRQVCPTATQTYTLLLILLNGTQQTHTITINVTGTCGNEICEPDENSSTCPADCGYLIG